MIPDHRHIRVCCGIFDFLHFCHRNEIFLSKYSNENFLGLILKVCFRLKMKLVFGTVAEKSFKMGFQFIEVLPRKFKIITFDT